jgi:hypothetical protein
MQPRRSARVGRLTAPVSYQNVEMVRHVYESGLFDRDPDAHAWTLHEGRLARFEWGQDLGKALDAAGGPE